LSSGRVISAVLLVQFLKRVSLLPACLLGCRISRRNAEDKAPVISAPSSQSRFVSTAVGNLFKTKNKTHNQ